MLFTRTHIVIQFKSKNLDDLATLMTTKLQNIQAVDLQQTSLERGGQRLAISAGRRTFHGWGGGREGVTFCVSVVHLCFTDEILFLTAIATMQEQHTEFCVAAQNDHTHTKSALTAEGAVNTS